MKKTKKMLLGTALAGTLVVVSAGFGTYSWFTSETNALGDMKSGVLAINDGIDIDTPIFSGTKFTPSQLQYGEWLSLSNTGDLDTYLKATYKHSVDKASLGAYEVGYMAMKYTKTPGQDVYEDSKIKLANLLKGTTNERSLSIPSNSDGVEIVGNVVSQEAVDSGEIIFGKGEKDSFWQLDEGQYIDIMIGIKLDESAGNEYQGATYSAAFNVIAKQTDEGAKYENK
ncbi:hypothetical protein [Paenisporosarcina sp. OV554]|uniref:hypothetical protein n=1 Tax=Paenisporosarcina sp. OV554 TaxID=2135694 RepID=UPI000D3ACE50|nr:hypothetical protein [Paenisporosarcina sp. OV554]PUB10637.1 spore coat-associated protein N [Paenisporosarcina sp. OV554]